MPIFDILDSYSLDLGVAMICERCSDRDTAIFACDRYPAGRLNVGDQAVIRIIAPALKTCTRPLHVFFNRCFLSADCIPALAAALRESRSLCQFVIIRNPAITASGYVTIKAALAASASPLSDGIFLSNDVYPIETLTKAQLVKYHMAILLVQMRGFDQNIVAEVLKHL